MTDKQLYKKTFDTVISSGMKPVEVDEIKKGNQRIRGLKSKSAVAVITICVLLGGGGIAYAYTNGIFDMLKQNYTTLFKEQEKEEQENLIVMETEPIETEEDYEGGNVFDEALYYGYVEQVEMYINELGVHDYRRVKKLSKEELEGSYYNDDYTEITIQGVKYHTMLQSKELDEEEELEDSPLKVWVFSEESWLDRSSVMAEEVKTSVIEGVVKPIMSGRVAIHNNDATRSFERNLTEEECANAQVCLYGHYVKLGEDIYVVNGMGQEDGIRLQPTQGYQGDAPVDETTLNALIFFSIDEWMEM